MSKRAPSKLDLTASGQALAGVFRRGVGLGLVFVQLVALKKLPVGVAKGSGTNLAVHLSVSIGTRNVGKGQVPIVPVPETPTAGIDRTASGPVDADRDWRLELSDNFVVVAVPIRVGEVVDNNVGGNHGAHVSTIGTVEGQPLRRPIRIELPDSPALKFCAAPCQSPVQTDIAKRRRLITDV